MTSSLNRRAQSSSGAVELEYKTQSSFKLGSHLTRKSNVSPRPPEDFGTNKDIEESLKGVDPEGDINSGSILKSSSNESNQGDDGAVGNKLQSHPLPIMENDLTSGGSNNSSQNREGHKQQHVKKRFMWRDDPISFCEEREHDPKPLVIQISEPSPSRK